MTCPPGVKSIWGLGALVLVTQFACTLRSVPEVLIWPHPHPHQHALVSSFPWCCLSCLSLGNLGVTSFNCFSVTSAPAPALAGSLVPHAPLPQHHLGAAVLAFYGFVSYSPRPVLTGPLAWLPASWQEQHVKCRPGRGWNGGDGLSVCLPLPELRIELLNKRRTRTDGSGKATFIQSPGI